jgi:16S rRNA (guanine527-N7)-methyltransferase
MDFSIENYVSRETIASLQHFESLLLKWSSRINLISKNTYGTSWERHILDSAQIIQYWPSKFDTWLDVGSGGGLPGIVLAIIARELNPDAKFSLVESDSRKCAFLRQASRDLSLTDNIMVQNSRIEDLDSGPVDVISARALASLDDLLSFASPYVGPKTTAIFPKGKSASQEVAMARKNWSFKLEEFQSSTDKDAKILKLRDIARV